MADHGQEQYRGAHAAAGSEIGRQGERRRGPDPVALIAGIAALFGSAYVITDGASWFPSLDPRWLLAGTALLVGVLMLVASTRSGRRR